MVLDANKKKIIIVVVILLIAISVYWFLIRKKKEEEVGAKATDDKGGASNSSVDPGSAAPIVTDSFPLKRIYPAKRGKRVEQLQAWLLRNYGNVLPKYGVDGVYGDETHDAVTKFLKRDNISESYFNKANMGAIKTTIFK